MVVHDIRYPMDPVGNPGNESILPRGIAASGRMEFTCQPELKDGWVAPAWDLRFSFFRNWSTVFRLCKTSFSGLTREEQKQSVCSGLKMVGWKKMKKKTVTGGSYLTGDGWKHFWRPDEASSGGNVTLGISNEAFWIGWDTLGEHPGAIFNSLEPQGPIFANI